MNSPDRDKPILTETKLMSTDPTQALSNIRVLDLSRVLAGPWASQHLADLGAEVIKIERPSIGDDTRGWGPPYLKDLVNADSKESAYYLSANRGKKSVTVNLSSAEGQEIIRQLAKESDVFIENFKVGDVARYGISYEDLKKVNPRLIYCSITGFGQDGPRSNFPGYDFIIQAMGGLMSVTGEHDNALGGGPQKGGIAVSDLMAGLFSAVAILAALVSRNITNQGQFIDIALLDCQVAGISGLNMNYLTSGVIPGRRGNAHENIVPYQVFSAKDCEFVVACGNDSQFAKLCKLMEAPTLSSDPRFTKNDDRVRNREALIPLLQDIFKEQPADFWITKMERAGVPCGLINNIAQVFEDPQVKHRQMLIELPHPKSGSVTLIANPIKFSGTPIRYNLAPPTLGQHTREILTSLGGVSNAEYDALVEKKIV